LSLDWNKRRYYPIDLGYFVSEHQELEGNAMIVDRIEKHFRILGRLKRKLDLTRRNREAGSLTRFDGSNLRYSSSELQIHDLEAWTSFAEETICQATWIYD
jgi:hypothetical protein